MSKTALITGASSGIGFETAKFLAKDYGYTVIALSRNEKKLLALAKSNHKNSKGKIIPMVVDLSVINSAGIPEQLKALKINSLDLLINNAGHLINKPFEKIRLSELEESYRVNVYAPYLLIQQLLPLLRKSKKAHIVNISSMGGVQGSLKFAGLSAYSPSKAALASLTECLAVELAAYKNIAVNCLALGAVQTEMLSKAFPGYKAPLKPAEMAAFISWFAVHAHQTTNGKIIPVALSNP